MPVINYKVGALPKWRTLALSSCQRHRLLWLAFFCCSCIHFVDTPNFFSTLLLVIALIGLIVQSIPFLLLSLTVSLIASIGHYQRCREIADNKNKISQTAWVDFHAFVNESPRLLMGSWVCRAKIVSAQPDLGIRRVLLYGRGAPPHLGETLSSRARWEPIPTPRNEGEFDRSRYLARLGIVTQCRLFSWQSMHPPNRWWKWTAEVRQGFENTLTKGLEPDCDEAKVILAMVMGKSPMHQDPVVEPFRQTGTLHLFSVSGQHVNLVAVILWFALRLVRVPRRHAVLILIPAIFGYAWLTGASAPSMRAAWMASIFLAAFFWQRKSSLMHALSIVLIAALLIDSNLLFLPGVQLSYGIVAVIAVGLAISHSLLDRFPWNDRYLPRELYSNHQVRLSNAWQRLIQSLVISLSAFFGSSLLTIPYFSLITPISVIANLVLTPMVAALLALSLTATSLSFVSSSAVQRCNQLNQWVAHCCLKTTQFFAQIPGAYWSVSFYRPNADTLRVFDLPRGGGAISVQSKHSEFLIDCGNQRAFSSIVLPSLQHFGSSPSHLYLSNPMAPHCGGTNEALTHLSLEKIIVPNTSSRTSSYRRLNRAVAQSKAVIVPSSPWHDLSNKDRVHCRPFVDSKATSDTLWSVDQSVIYLVDFHGFQILCWQDASASMLESFLRAQPTFRCDVLILGRHPRHPPTLIDLIQAFEPKAIIASHDDFPEWEMIPDDWPDIAKKHQISLFHQGQTGMVTLRLQDDQSLLLSAFLQQQSEVIQLKRAR